MTARRFALVSFGVALLTSGLLLVVPTYAGVEAVSSSSGAMTGRSFRATLVQVNGLGVVLRLLAVPVVLTGATLVPWGRLQYAVHAVSAGLMLAFVLFTGFSIGLFYVPTAAMTCFAAGRADEARRPTAVHPIPTSDR